MDAKAKVEVEAWQYRFMGTAGWSKWAFVGSMFDPNDVPDGYEVRALIPLTDHEAALAELQASKDALNASWHSLLDENRALEKRNATLLTGLEALAGEWDEDAAEDRENGHLNPGGPSDLFARLLRARIATLTNSAKGNDHG